MTVYDIAVERIMRDRRTQPRPITRADCKLAPRPCPWVECRHYMGGGACVLDVVDENPDGLERVDVAQFIGRDRQYVDHYERKALDKLRKRAVVLRVMNAQLNESSSGEREVGRRRYVRPA